jgi:hypothetical protein
MEKFNPLTLSWVSYRQEGEKTPAAHGDGGFSFFNIGI